MARPAALRVAMDLSRLPLLARMAQKQPLPPGMLIVIRIAGGCAETLDRAAAITGDSPERIRQAAVFFLQTVLFAQDADSYRILGAERSAPQAELRDHMRWLMKWLHPDRERNEWESSLALRVSSAWDDLKSAERRLVYDEQHPVPAGVSAASPRPHRRQRQGRIPWIRGPLPSRATGRGRRRRIVTLGAIIAVGAGFAASVWGWPGFVDGLDWHAYGRSAGQIGSSAR